ncbi:MAG TPA: SusC/RagA family TonB-linked outer membrane protein, partial [Niastella sp.]
MRMIAHSRFRRFFTFLFAGYLSFSGVVCLAQDNIKVQGSITGKNGEGLPNVTISVVNSNLSSVSDSIGRFTITVPSGSTLQFSYIGYYNKLQKVNSATMLNIQLAENPGYQQMSDVVVVGYGKQKSPTVTGAVGVISGKDLIQTPVANISNMLIGRTAGISGVQATGEPGLNNTTIRIRGIATLNGQDPLIVIDGIQQPAEQPFLILNAMDANEIESISILKDASATAVYGIRGANGVIIVTTKLGKAGKPQVNLAYELGLQKVLRKVEVMDAQQWIQYYIDARNNAWVASGPGRKASDPNSVRGSKTYLIPPDFLTDPQQFGKGTDWQDVLFRTAKSQNVQASVSGGTDKAQYLFSAGYLNQDAVVIDNFYKRLSLRMNIRQKITEKVTAGLNFSFTGIHSRIDGIEGKSDVVSLAQQSDPIFPVYNENGNLGFLDPNSTWNRFTQYGVQLWHPYSLIKYADKLNKAYNTIAGAYIEYKPIKDLTFKSSANAILTQRNYNWFWRTNAGYGYSTLLPAEGRYSTYNNLNWLSENSLSYDKVLGDHTIGALVAYTAQKQRGDTSQQRSTNYPNDLVQTLNAAGTYSLSTTTAGEWALLSWLSRVSYSYKNRYFLNGTIRRDGSSRFGQDSRWGYFPSLSLGWLVSDEAFMQNVSAINNLKLRVSYGSTGNNQIPNYGPISLLDGSKYAYSDNVVNGVRVTTIPNPNLKWEKTTQFNVGVDVTALNNRLNVTAEFYNSTTKDLLLNVPVPILTGFATQLTNIGKIRNRGVELSISSKNIVNSNLKWTTDF